MVKLLSLTYDVLAPVIKVDGEKEEKLHDKAAARKKAYKRAFIIAIFSLQAAGLSGF